MLASGAKGRPNGAGTGYLIKVGKNTGSAPDVSEVKRARGHRPRKLNPAQEAAFLAHLRMHPNMTVSQAKAWLLAKHGVRISMGATWNTMKRLTSSLEAATAF